MIRRNPTDPMCHFITAVLAADTDLGALSDIATRHQRRLAPLSNPSVQRVLRQGERYCLTTLGHCDCDTALGQARRQRATTGEDEARKLRRKGWSEAKIARALRQSADRRQASEAAKAAAGTNDLQHWRDFLEALLDQGRQAYVGLLLHFYQGGLDEDIELRGRVTQSLLGVDGDWLACIEEDVIYEIRR